MAPCNNVITPTMIRKGHVQIGDKIEFEDVAVSAQNITEAPSPEVNPELSPEVSPVVSSAIPETASEAVPESEAAAPAVSEAVTEPQETVTAANMQSTTTSNMTNDSGVWLRPQAGGTNNYNGTVSNPGAQAGSTSPSYINPNAAFQANTVSIPLIYHNMTDYVNSLENSGQQTPSFGVPSSPLVPPEYEQTIDYDSIQYMNGFLRTQIGRYMRVEQMIGSDSTEDRYGFLVGVGNNYVLLQDVSNGNVAIVDLYTIKYVYMYFGEPVFPNIPFGVSGR